MTIGAGHTHKNKAELQQLLSQRDAEIARQSAELQAHDLLIEKLKLQLANLRRQRFGTKSEALDKIIDQLELALVEAEAAAEHHDCEPPPAVTEAKGQPTRKPLPDHLPREDVVLSPGEACEQCGGVLRHLGEDVSKTLEYVPGRFKVIRTVRPKMSCRCCETIHQVPAPLMPIERGRMGPGLIAHVLVSKFSDHIPLYRQSQIYARERVPLERSTMSDGVGGSTDFLEVLADAIGRHVMTGVAIHADDTPVEVLAPGTGRTKTGGCGSISEMSGIGLATSIQRRFTSLHQIAGGSGHEII
jgi:transposase